MRTSILAALIAAACSSVSVHAQPAAETATPPRDTVVSSGEGLVKRAPDRAFVTVASEARSRQPREAQAQNAAVMTAVRQRLSGFTLPDEAIRTLSVDMHPEFDWADGKQTLRGYLASNVIEVRLDDVARVGDVIDAVVGAGATRVTGVRFTLKDMAGTEREALRLASADALARARALADGAGRGVDRVIRLDETGRTSEPPVPMMRATMQMADAEMKTTPVTAGEVEVRVSVTLTALLK